MAAKCKASFIVFLHRLPPRWRGRRWGVARWDRSEAIVAFTARHALVTFVCDVETRPIARSATSRCPTGSIVKQECIGVLIHLLEDPLRMRFCATEGSPCSIVSCRFCTLSRGGSDGVAAVIRDSLLYAVTWQARKGRLEIPGSRREASSYNSTRMRASSRIENYHNDIHICRRIAGILGRSFYCPESWISRDLEGDRERVSDLVLANVYGVAFILQVIARLQVTRGFINCLDVISP